MKKVLKIILFLTVVLVVVGVLLYYRGNNKTDMTVHSSGIVEGPEVNLAPKVSGRISEICCRESDPVSKGQIVVRLDSADLSASVEQAAAGVEKAKTDIKSAEAAVESARAGARSAEADVKSAEADSEKLRVRMEEAKREADRAISLYRNQYISKESLDQLVAAYDSSVADYRSSASRINAAVSRKEASAAQTNLSLSQMNSAKAGLKAAEAVLSYNRAKLNDTVIVSPSAGTVIFRPMENGETVTQGSTVLTIVDTANLYVRVDIDESLIGPVTPDAPVKIKVEGMPNKRFSGKVVEIGRYAEFATQRDVVRGRQDIRTFRVKIRTDDTEKLLKPGMTVEVEIEKKGGLK